MSDRAIVVRDGTPADVDAAVAVWLASELARRGGRALPTTSEARVRASLVGSADNFLLVAEDEQVVVGMAAGMPALADDGAGPPIAGLCHVRMVFVAPGR